MKSIFLPFLCSALLIFWTPFSAFAEAELWAVELSKKQARKLPDVLGYERHSAFAISPDGAWGTSWNYETDGEAKQGALQRCRQRLKIGKRDCFIYVVNGQVVAKPVVSVTRIQEIYKPLHRNRAAAFFGVADITFYGDRQKALLQLEDAKSGIDVSLRYGRDKYVEGLFVGKTLMSNKSKGFGIWFDNGWAEQHYSANSGTLKKAIPQWMATKEGLLCMYGAYWRSTNKPSGGAGCLIVNSIKNGVVNFSWSNSSNTERRGHLIAGNGLVTSIR